MREELKGKGYNIDKNKISTASSLSCLGTHVVNVELHKQVIANLKVNLVK